MSERSGTNSDSTGEWRARTGSHPQIDTAKLRALDGASAVAGIWTDGSGTDPYNRTATAAPDAEKPRRRSLDDMRKLSELIKKSR
jgi:hypothetical protein